MTKLIPLSVILLVFIGFVLASPHSSTRGSTEKTTEKSGETSTAHPVKKHKRHRNFTALQEPDEIPDEGWNFENRTHVDTRRILFSKRTEKGKRAYMVYLQLTKESAKAHKYRGWLCGGVVVDPYYVLTSAACVEDADRFYIVSGTTKFVDSFDYKSDECVCKHRRRVVWKCIPKNYKFDFQDSIKWSSNDIAIVKVDKAFKFGNLEAGCEFPVCPIVYNNVSRELEKPGTKGWIAGWGSGNNFREGVYRRQKEVHIPKNAKCLQEAKVCIMDNEQCAKKWAQRFRDIITQYMICTKDVMKRLSEVCDKRYANCTDVETRRSPDEDIELAHNLINIDLGRHLRDPYDYTARRSSMQGGFCENDHGGPLIVKHRGVETVVGVISACKIDPKSHSCHGPFLYTSVYRNRQFISCAIHKDVEQNCRRVFRSGITHEEWSVNWDDVQDEESESSPGNKVEDKKSDSESSEMESKEVLRQSKDEPPEVASPPPPPPPTKKEKKSKKVVAEESSSSSSEEEEEEEVVTVPTTTTEKPEEETTKVVEVAEKAVSKKHKKHKSKKHKLKAEEKEAKVKKAKPVSVEEVVATTTVKPKDPVSYESSEEENVNNPVEE